jgi:hypothetical protein
MAIGTFKSIGSANGAHVFEGARGGLKYITASGKPKYVKRNQVNFVAK